MVIQQLLGEAGKEGFDPALVTVEPQGTEVAADWSNLRTPETYLSYGRLTASPLQTVNASRSLTTIPSRRG